MSTRETLHLLLLTNSHNESESIVSLLRNSGSATRAHQIESLVDFTKQLQEKSWDLLLTCPKVGDIGYEELLQQIKRLNKDLPLIILGEDVNAMELEACLKKGASALVPQDEQALLLLVIKNELNHLAIRRKLRTAEVLLREAENRCQNLLESSRDAVAYIHDGMHVHANKAYLDLFGYKTTSDLEGTPIMDMIATEEQQEFKAFLKKQQQDDTQEHTLKSVGINGKHEKFPMRMQFTPATYADEQCTQVSIEIAADNSELEERLKEISRLDLQTGLYNKPYFISRVFDAVDKAVRKGINGAAIYINLDGYDKIKKDVGIASADTVVSAIASAIKEYSRETDVLARISEDVFCALRIGIDADSALKYAESLRRLIENKLIEVGNRTVTTTASIGVALITDNSPHPDDILQQAHQASDDVRKLEGNEHGNGVHLFVPKLNKDDGAADLSALLTDAIRKNSFRLLFQPMISLRDDDHEHYETSLRLILPDGEELSAGEFFANPDVSDDLKRKIDRWVVLHTTKLLGEHRAQGHTTNMFINLSGASLLDEALPNWIAVALNTASLPKSAAVFQFHEDDASRALKQAQTFTIALQEKGIRSSLSRFGCALNPMNILKHLAVTYVKVDGSFTKDINTAEAQNHLKELLTELHEEEKITIVPLVENASSMAFLWQAGVHFIQGYYVQAPQTAMQFNFHEEENDSF